MRCFTFLFFRYWPHISLRLCHKLAINRIFFEPLSYGGNLHSYKCTALLHENTSLPICIFPAASSRTTFGQRTLRTSRENFSMEAPHWIPIIGALLITAQLTHVQAQDTTEQISEDTTTSSSDSGSDGINNKAKIIIIVLSAVAGVATICLGE